MFPKYWSDMFQPFLNDIPGRPFAEVVATVEAELGKPITESFASFAETPLGVASIGQVHRAVLNDGTRVVVKVQNPTAETNFRGDVFAIKTLIDAFAPQVSPAFEEMEKQFATEFDYRGEAKNGDDVRANLEASGWLAKDVLVPRNFSATKSVLVMEEIYPSIPLHTALDRQLELLAKQRGISKQALMDEEMAKMDEEAREAARTGKLKRTVSMHTYDKFIALQRSRRTVMRAYAKLWNYSVGLLLPKSLKYDLSSVGSDVMVPINAARLVDTLLAVHGQEVLLDGAFNTDPHPGNILFVDGKHPKLGLIDYGQVKRLTKEQRLNVCRSIVIVDAAIKLDPRSNPDVDPREHQAARAGVCKMFLELGFRTEKNDPEVHYQMATTFLGRVDRAWLYPQNLIQASDEWQAKDPVRDVTPVDYFVMINITTFMLRGLAEMLRQPRNLASCWAPYARQALATEGELAEVDKEIASWKLPKP